MEGPPVHRYAVQVLARSFQLSGQLDTVGNLLDFLSDPVRDALILSQAHVAPLTPGGPVRGMTLPEVSVRKQEVVLLYFPEQEAREQIRLWVREETFIVYTPVGVLRGALRLSAEARLDDFLSTMTGAFLPVTNVNLFLLTELPAPFPEKCDLLLVGRQHIQLYHPVS